MSEFKIGDRVRVTSDDVTGLLGRDGVVSEILEIGGGRFECEVEIDDQEYLFTYEELELIEADPVNHPAHYTQFPVEVIDITEHLSFNLGNVVKYACRAGRKDGADPIEDLRKAEFYLKREIGRLSSE